MNCGENKPKKRNLFKRTFQKIRYKIEQYFERKKPSRFEIWARKELEMIEKQCDDVDSLEMQRMITKDIMAIVKVFANQGHSGFSASYTLNLIKRLLDWKPISPLTGEEDEWDNRLDPSDSNSQQNKRCSAVFRKNFDNSTAYYLYGKVFSDDGGMTWFTKRESFVPVTFPYNVPLEPEYIYLDKEGNEITREQAKELFKDEEKESEVNE